MKSPKHPKAKFYSQQGLFNDLKSFEALERRIAVLASPIEKGDAFEVFTEALLATYPTLSAIKVWPWCSVPREIKEKLQIDLTKDKGIDGIYINKSGEIIGYQAKFRTSRVPLNWGRDLSTFIGLAHKCKFKLIITNSFKLPDDVFLPRNDILSFRGSNLDHLTAPDFDRIESWVQGQRNDFKLKTPNPHQIEAIKKIQHELSIADRATSVMACGTGKSLVSLWVAESLNSNITLVFVPSLALISQLLNEWVTQTSWSNFSFICICSDRTVSKSIETKTHQSDLTFPVTTTSGKLKKYLINGSEKKIIFSTYQSAQVISDAMDQGQEIGLAIFDEAHKTAGRAGKKFGYALNNKNIQIHKRLFLTATPKHYSVRKNTKIDDEKPVYSMDNRSIYGKTCYRLTFAEAARKKIICNYKVVVTIITKDLVNRHLLQSSGVEVGSDFVKARQVANQLAIKNCIENYGVKKIISFHNSIEAAKSFTANDSQGIASHIRNLSMFHVNGKLSAGKREQEISEFKLAELGLMSNSRCLTEGVDVPSVDLVAFMSPKRSQIDVIQATGRAMRTNPESEKETGYVLVPIYLELESGESITHAINETEFGEVFDVLNALQEQDEILASSMCTIRERLKEPKGYLDELFEQLVDINCPALQLDDLKEVIITKIIKRLTPIWHEHYSDLTNYFKKYGNSDVPSVWQANQTLSNWVKTQRQLYSLVLLQKERELKLEALNFSWSMQESRWEDNYLILLEYIEEYGCAKISNDPQYSALKNWANTQRKEHKDGRLSSDRVELLDNEGFVWDITASRWQEKYLELHDLYEHANSCSVPKEKQYQHLASWVRQQRKDYIDGSLTTEKIELLNKLSFEWVIINSGDGPWNAKYSMLKAYFIKHNSSYVPARYPGFGSWCAFQRGYHREGELSAERIDKLNKLNFIWEPRDEEWLKKYAQVLEFKKKNGHFSIPLHSPTYGHLPTWLATQRSEYSKYQKSDDPLLRARATYLKEIVSSKKRNRGETHEQFLEKLERLVAYKKVYGHCRVPKKWKEDAELGRWVDYQRQKFRKKSLLSNRIELLEGVDFEFSLKLKLTARKNISSDVFDVRLTQLTEFLKSNGHTNIPVRSDDGLGRWLSGLKTKYRQNKLNFSQVEKLKTMGVDFSYKTTTPSNKPKKAIGTRLSNKTKTPSNTFKIDAQFEYWLERFKELAVFSERFGHCNATVSSKEYGSLGSWVKSQRANYRQGKLTSNQIAMLGGLRFEFIAPKNENTKTWGERYNDLYDHFNVHGDLKFPQATKENVTLRNWLKAQVVKGRKGSLNEEKMKKLRSCGVQFESKPMSPSWDGRYQELLDYKAVNGHVDVPQLYGGSTGLGRWVNRQRQYLRLGKIQPSRQERLDNIDFLWNRPKGQRERVITKP